MHVHFNFASVVSDVAGHGIIPFVLNICEINVFMVWWSVRVRQGWWSMDLGDAFHQRITIWETTLLIWNLITGCANFLKILLLSEVGHLQFEIELRRTLGCCEAAWLLGSQLGWIVNLESLGVSIVLYWGDIYYWIRFISFDGWERLLAILLLRLQSLFQIFTLTVYCGLGWV